MKLDKSKTIVFATFLITISIVSTGLGTVCTASALTSTYLFADSFESGNFSKLNGTRTTSGETATVTDILPHHGVYGAIFASNGSGGSENAYCYVTVNLDEVYVRGYVYLDRGLPLSDNDDRFYLLGLVGTGQNLAYAGICRTPAGAGGVDRWMVSGRNGSSWMGRIYADDPGDPLPQIGRWYCVELHWKLDSAAGLIELYVDGVRIIEIGGIDTDNFGNAVEVDFGLIHVTNVQNRLAVYGDCFVVSKTYVGLSCSKPDILGDVNGDGIVNLADLVSVAAAYGSHRGDEGWNPAADLNNDGVMDLHDLAIFATQYGESTQSQPPESGLIVGTDVWCGTTASTFLGRTDLPLMQACGIQMVRLEFNRNSVSNLRTLVPTVVNNRIKVLGLLIRKDLIGNITGWGNWVYSIVSEFKKYVHVWECWNEPNLDQYFSGADPVKYTEFLKIMYTKAKQADPGCEVLGGSVCSTQQSSLNFLVAMYNSGAKDYMDALSYHPYCAPYSAINTNVRNAYERLETQVRPIMVRNGDIDKKIWITEMGWTTDDVTEAQQATYMTQALAMARDWGWVETFIVYNWQDGGGFTYGLLHDGSVSPKPSFYAVKNFING